MFEMELGLMEKEGTGGEDKRVGWEEDDTPWFFRVGGMGGGSC